MTQPSIASQIHCGQCGAELPVDHGSQFVTCAFCSTASFVDKAAIVFHYALRATIHENDALAALRRWMAGNATVKDLDQKAQIERPVFEHFPLWLVKVDHGEEERVYVKPAAALSVSELEHITVPAADLEPYNRASAAAAVSPTVPYETMRQWLVDDYAVKSEAVREVSLVHVPIYTCKYGFDGGRYTAIVDAATSKVFANIYPSKWEVPYQAIGAIAFFVYLGAAFIPLLGYLLNGAQGLVTSLVVYGVIATVLSIPILVGAALVSAKV